METNPYAPPTAAVADVEPSSHGLKRVSVLLMIALMIVTLGVYYVVWWFRRRPGLNRLDSPEKLAVWPLVLWVALFVMQFGLGVISGTAPPEEVVGEGGVMFVTFFQFAVGIAMIVQAFKVKGMIEDHAAPPPEAGPITVEPVKLSGLMTFFFSIFYLQWAINRYVVGPRA